MTPAFFWSNYQYFSGRNSYISRSLDQANLSDLVKSFASVEGPLAQAVVKGEKPALVVGVIVEDEKSISQVNLKPFADPPQAGSLSWIERNVHTSPSSLVIPNTFNVPSAAGKSLIERIASNSLSSSNVTIVSDDDSVEGAISYKSMSFKDALATQLTALNSDRTSLVLLKASNARHAGEMLEVVKASLSPSIKVVYFVTANADVSSEPLLLQSGHRLLLQATNSTVQPPVYMTPEILFGLLLSFFLIFMLLIGFCCLMSVQGSSYYAPSYPQKGKEY
jgi:hypothetical protein